MRNFEKHENELKNMDLTEMINFFKEMSLVTVKDAIDYLYKQYEPFTQDEKIILNNLPEKYKWIARNKNGDLVVYDKKPRRNDYGSFYVYYGFFENLRMFKHLFRNITWQSGAVCFRGDECE